MEGLVEKKIKRRLSFSLREESEFKKKFAKEAQHNELIKIFSVADEKYFSAWRSDWGQAPWVNSVLNNGEQRVDTVKVVWTIKEIEQMDGYFRAKDQESFVNNLSVSHHIQLINNLSGLTATKQNGCNDYDRTVQLLVDRPASSSQENIECLLQKVDSLRDDIDQMVMKAALLKSPEFYQFFVCDTNNELIEEEELSENIVMKRYWGNTIHLCDCAGNVSKEYKDVSVVLKVANTLVIGIAKNIIKLIDVRDLSEKDICSQVFSNVFRINRHKIGIAFLATDEDDDSLIVRDIKTNEEKKLGDIPDAFQVNDYLIATKFGIGNPIVDEFGNGKYEIHAVHLYDVEKEEFVKEISFPNVRDSFRVNDDVIVMRYNNKAVVYNVGTKKKKNYLFHNLNECFRVNDYMIVLHNNEDIVVVNIKAKKIIKKFKNSGKVCRVNDRIIATYSSNVLRLYDVGPREVKNFYFNYNEKILSIEKINIIKELIIVGYKTIADPNHLVVAVFTSKSGNLIARKETNEGFEMRGNAIWLLDNGMLKRFGPSLNIKKLTAEQLLLFLSALRSYKYPSDVNNSIWESIDDNLKKRLLIDIICSRLSHRLSSSFGLLKFNAIPIAT